MSQPTANDWKAGLVVGLTFALCFKLLALSLFFAGHMAVEMALHVLVFLIIVALAWLPFGRRRRSVQRRVLENTIFAIAYIASFWLFIRLPWCSNLD